MRLVCIEQHVTQWLFAYKSQRILRSVKGHFRTTLDNQSEQASMICHIWHEYVECTILMVIWRWYPSQELQGGRMVSRGQTQPGAERQASLNVSIYLS